MDEIRKFLMRMGHTATAAQAHYQIWFTLCGKGKALPEYRKDMNDFRYVDFFHVVNAGNYKLMFLELGCLFDPDLRSASFRNLKSALVEIGRSDIANQIGIVLAPYGDLVSNVLTIRSKLIAHKDLSASSEIVLQDYPVIPNKMAELLNVCSELINKLDAQLFGETGCSITITTNRFENATFELLSVIRNGRS